MPFDPAEAVDIGAFVMAAYRMYNNGKAGLTPAPLGIPAGYTVHSYIIMNDFLPWKSMQEFYGFIATKDDQTQSVVAMRGTIGATEWLDNVQTGLVPFPAFPGCGSIEQGFGKIYTTIQVVPPGWDPHAVAAPSTKTFAEQVASVIAQHVGMSIAAVAGAQSVIATGHSLGAALITLYVMENVRKSLLNTPLVYTFASPRVGDTTFVNTYNGLPNVTTWRIFNKNDLVPNVPPDTWGFGHVNTPIEIDDTDIAKDNVECHHALATYMHVLVPAQWPLDANCVP